MQSERGRGIASALGSVSANKIRRALVADPPKASGNVSQIRELVQCYDDGLLRCPPECACDPLKEVDRMPHENVSPLHLGLSSVCGPSVALCSEICVVAIPPFGDLCSINM
jgi:hypothetical protein